MLRRSAHLLSTLCIITYFILTTLWGRYFVFTIVCPKSQASKQQNQFKLRQLTLESIILFCRSKKDKREEKKHKNWKFKKKKKKHRHQRLKIMLFRCLKTLIALKTQTCQGTWHLTIILDHWKIPMFNRPKKILTFFTSYRRTLILFKSK